MQALDATLPPSGAALQIPAYTLGEVLGRGSKEVELTRDIDLDAPLVPEARETGPD